MKTSVGTQILQNCEDFKHWLKNCPAQDFSKSAGGVWSQGQVVQHLIQSVNPLLLAFRLPHWLLGLLFGKNKGGSRSLEEIISLYQEKLKNGAKATREYIPKEIADSQKEKLIQEFLYKHQKLVKMVEQKSDAELDTFRLPHPIIGKITLREMLFFTQYHIRHHLLVLQNRK